jgi:prevent-host-death family protein
MRTISATDAKQSFAALLDTAQREPVVIRRHERDVAVLLPVSQYERMRGVRIQEFQRFCNRVAEEAKARGMNESVLEEILRS